MTTSTQLVNRPLFRIVSARKEEWKGSGGVARSSRLTKVAGKNEMRQIEGGGGTPSPLLTSPNVQNKK